MARKKTEPAPVAPADPDQQLLLRFLEIANAPPDEAAAMIKTLNGLLTDEQFEELVARFMRTLLPHRARLFNLDGYCAYYEMMHGFAPPEHIRKEVEVILSAKQDEKGQLIIASRGSWKTVSITLTFTPWFIGHHPTTASLIIQAGESSANSSGSTIADHIRYHPAFAATFPHVVPNMGKRWSEEGYEMRMTHTDASLSTPLSDGEWEKMNSARKDPSLLAVSYNSKSIVGKHPDGLFLIDDIHDEENTKSQSLLDDVIAKLRANILPTIYSLRDESRPKGEQIPTYIVAIGTPWVEGDGLAYLEETGEFHVHRFAVLEEAAADNPEAIFIDHTNKRGEELRGWFKLNWKNKFGLESIKAAFNTSGAFDFWRMYLLLFKAKKGEGVRFTLFPAHLIDPTQDAAGGCDYASVMKDHNVDLKDRSRFAHVYVVKIPTLNKLVVHECVSEHFSQLEAEQQLNKPQVVFPRWKGTWLEMDGKGEEAYQTFSRNPKLKIIPTTTKGVSKDRRQEVGVIPWLESGQVMISDRDTPGLARLRAALNKYPNGNSDERDALFHALKAFPEVLRFEDTSEGAIPQALRLRQPKPNPMTLAFGRA